MQIIWTSPARSDLYAAFDYISQDNINAALLVIERIEESVEHLSQHPEIGRKGRVNGTRELVIPRTPYVISYRVKHDKVEILAVIHGSRKWPDNF